MRTVRTSRTSSRLGSLAAVVVAAVIAVLGTATGAQAHTELSSSVPAADATVTARSTPSS